MTTNQSGLGTTLRAILDRPMPTTDQEWTELIRDTMAVSKTPAGVARVLRKVADGEAGHTSRGTRAIIGGCATVVADMLPADDPHAALGRVVVECFESDPEWWCRFMPIAVVDAVRELPS